MKRRIVVLSLILVIVAVLSVGTLAYHVTYGVSQNVITAGNVDAVLHNLAADGTEATKDVVCLPGGKVDRIVTVENVGTHPFYVRIRLTKYVKDSVLSAEDCLHLDLNTEDWTYQDGYYYYQKVLQPGLTTEPLFTQVEVDGKNVDNAYLGKDLMLDVSAYVVQSQNNGQTVWDAVGWPKP